MSIALKERIFVTEKSRILPFENNLVTLVLEGGRAFEGVEPRRLFPVNSPSTYITLLDADGKEVALIPSLDELDESSREVVKRSLEDYYLVPTIESILNITDRYGTLRWTVETDRGEISFDVRDRNHDIRVYRDGRVRVRDSADNRYVIGDYRKMDKKSQRHLTPFI